MKPQIYYLRRGLEAVKLAAGALENYLYRGEYINKDRKLKCLKRGYETARQFAMENSINGKNKGLLILLGTKSGIEKVVAKLDNELLDKYSREGELFFSNNVFKLYEDMAKRDGAVAFDFNGNLLCTEVVVPKIYEKGMEQLMKEIKERRGKNGAMTRHTAAAYACLHNLSSIVVSEERGTVITLSDGKFVDSLFYNPLVNQLKPKEQAKF